MVGPWKVHHLEGENLQAKVGSAAKRDGQIDLPEVCLRSQDYPVEGGARRAEFRLGDVQGIKGVDVQDVEATATVHRHLRKPLLVDNGVDNERIASWSCDVGGMVPLIIGDRRFRPAEEGGDGRLGGACLPIAHLVLAFGPDGIGSTEDHDALLRFGEAISVLACRASFLGCRLFAVSLLWPAGLSEEMFEELTVLVEVFDGVGVVGAWAIHELIEVVRQSLLGLLGRAIGHGDQRGAARPALALCLSRPPLKTAPSTSSLKAWLVVTLSRSRVVRGFKQPSLWIRDSQFVPERNALMTSASTISGRELHCWENLQM